MAERYFEKLGLFTYSNTVCVDITKRTVIANTIQQDLWAYFPYEMKSQQRPDTIAYRYYKDSHCDWLVYLSNKTVDPYYAFPMADDTFNNFIVDKYGSLAAAQDLILWWDMNWYGSFEDQISQSFYDSTLPEQLKKYYEAVYGEETRILYYRRRREDWRASTNMIYYFGVSNTAGTFKVGEKLNLKDGNTYLSNSYVTFANSSQVTVQHVMGNVSSNSVTQYISGTQSGATANVSLIVNVANNFPIAEQVYWSPTYAYDYEQGENERKKFIRLIDSKYKVQIAEKIRKAYQQ